MFFKYISYPLLSGFLCSPSSSLTDSPLVSPQSWHAVRGSSGGCIKLWADLSHPYSRTHGWQLSLSSTTNSSVEALSSHHAGFSQLHTALPMGEKKIHAQKTQHAIISSAAILIPQWHYDSYGYVICLHTCVCVLTICFWFLFSEGTEIEHLSVYLGKSALNETDVDREQRFNVEKLIIHQKYNKSFDNDIGEHTPHCVCVYMSVKKKELYGCSVGRAQRCVCLYVSALLKLKSRNGECAMKSASARTVCLPPFHTKLPAGFQCSIAGFGMERHSKYQQ